ERYDSALALLARVANKDAAALTDDESKRIQALAAGKTSIAEEAKLDAKMEALHEKEAALHSAILAAKAHDVDPAVDAIAGASAGLPAVQNASDAADLTAKGKQQDRDDAATDVQAAQT